MSLTTSQRHIHLLTSWGYVMASEASPLARLPQVSARDLRGLVCIVVCPPEQEATEQAYYRDRLNFDCDFVRADTLEQARFMVAGNRGFLPVGTRNEAEPRGTVMQRIPMMTAAPDGTSALVHDHSDYYAFWLRAHEHPGAPEFAAILKELFA